MKIFIGTLVVLLLAVVAWWFLSYDPDEWHGASPMRDTGFFSYPRYHADLGNIPFTEPGRHSLRFSGLPSKRMTLLLIVVEDSETDYDLVRSLRTEIDARIVDSDGAQVCSASGSPSNSQSSDRWVTTTSWDPTIDRSHSAFWHVHCRDVSFSRRADYTLQLSVSDIDPRSPPAVLRATLEGGGNELP